MLSFFVLAIKNILNDTFKMLPEEWELTSYTYVPGWSFIHLILFNSYSYEVGLTITSRYS